MKLDPYPVVKYSCLMTFSSNFSVSSREKVAWFKVHINLPVSYFDFILILLLLLFWAQCMKRLTHSLVRLISYSSPFTWPCFRLFSLYPWPYPLFCFQTISCERFRDCKTKSFAPARRYDIRRQIVKLQIHI